MKVFHPFGKKAGMLISIEDMKYRPLSVCRSEYAWISTDKGEITVLNFKVDGDTILLPFKTWVDALIQEEPKEVGIELIRRIHGKAII